MYAEFVLMGIALDVHKDVISITHPDTNKWNLLCQHVLECWVASEPSRKVFTHNEKY